VTAGALVKPLTIVSDVATVLCLGTSNHGLASKHALTAHFQSPQTLPPLILVPSSTVEVSIYQKPYFLIS
jgi:hypothetical protein